MGLVTQNHSFTHYGQLSKSLDLRAKKRLLKRITRSKKALKGTLTYILGIR